MSADLVRMREELAVRLEELGCGPLIGAAFRDVARHLFVPGVPPEEAYSDEPIVTRRNASGVPVSSSSQPAIMAIMLRQLDLAPGQRVLEIGAGTGYNAALMKHIVGASGHVTSVDLDPEVAREATEHLAAAGYPDVTVVAADGANGSAEHAPYDRVIATVGVSDLAPAWLAQASPDAMIVVPLDVRGAQLSVAFARADGHWASRSIAPCGFMRMRGAMAGATAIMVLVPGVRLVLPEERSLDTPALAAALAAPPAAIEPTGVSASTSSVLWGLNLWLALRENRACELAEEIQPDRAPRLSEPPISGSRFHATYGIVAAGSIAVLSRGPDAELNVSGYGPDGPALAADLAGRVRAWDAAGRPDTGGLRAGLRIDAYPRDAGMTVPRDAVIIERPSTRFAVYHA